jgi:hypothetical protein
VNSHADCVVVWLQAVNDNQVEAMQAVMQFDEVADGQAEAFDDRVACIGSRFQNYIHVNIVWMTWEGKPDEERSPGRFQMHRNKTLNDILLAYEDRVADLIVHNNSESKMLWIKDNGYTVELKDLEIKIGTLSQSHPSHSSIRSLSLYILYHCTPLSHTVFCLTPQMSIRSLSTCTRLCWLRPSH